MSAHQHARLPLLISTVIIFLFHTATAQKTDQRMFQVVVNEDDYTRDFSVIDKEKTLFVAPNRDYHWYKSNKVLTTKGGQGGRLLHGEYKEYHLNKNLRTRGKLKKGQHVGHWKEWWPNGMVKSSYHHRFGMKHGRQFNYNSQGDLTDITRYRRGNKHGWTKLFSDEKKIARELYKRGKLVRSKTLMPVSENADPIPSAEEADPVPKEKTVKEHKRLKSASRKNRGDIPETPTTPDEAKDDH